MGQGCRAIRCTEGDATSSGRNELAKSVEGQPLPTHDALHLCARASLQAIRSLVTSVSRAMSEGGRSYLDRQPDVNKRSLVAAVEPGLRLIESIRSRYLEPVH